MRESWASGLFMIASAFGPKIFQRPSTWTATSSSFAVLVPVGWDAVLVVGVVMGMSP